ncbi:MAG TPA: tetratricopeptide repeat protein [Candidatus Acidoferrum sp.]
MRHWTPSGQEALSQNLSRQKADYAAAAEAFQKELARVPGSAELWMKWADFDLERFRILDLELRSAQSGMAVVLRLEAQGLHSGPETREELLRLSATADPEQQGIWGELGMEQVRSGKREAAAATLKTALERQPNDLWTLRLEAMMAARRDDWRSAENHLLNLGSRSPAVLRQQMQSWPKNLIPNESVKGEIWECARKQSAACLEKIKFPAEEAPEEEEQLFAEERWEQLVALPEPPSEVPAAWFRRGVAFAELSDCPRAIPSLERGLGTGAETAAYWLELCYATEAEHASARIHALGNEAIFHRVRGDSLVRVKGDLKGATQEYEKARRLQPRDAVLAERLAQAYESLGDMQRAQRAGQEALALDPHRMVSLRLLASIAMNERNYSDALPVLRQLLDKNPNDAWARVQMGIAYAQTNQPQRALSYLQPILAAGYPDERGALHGMLAGVLRKLGREQEAEAAAAEAKRLSDLFQQHGEGPTTRPKGQR